MTDTALIENGVVTQVWRETEAASLAETHPDWTLHEFPANSAVCGMLWDGVTLANPPPPPIDINVLRSSRIADAWTECQRRISTDDITVHTSAGDLPFGIDDITRDNLQQVVIGIDVMPAGTVPNPRPWSPKGSAPVLLTHDDLRGVTVAVGRAYDARMQAYFVHKGTLKAMADAAALSAYDVTTGYPPPNGVITIDASASPERIANLETTVQALANTLRDLGTASP